jgi:hypothetical protein
MRKTLIVMSVASSLGLLLASQLHKPAIGKRAELPFKNPIDKAIDKTERRLDNFQTTNQPEHQK